MLIPIDVSIIYFYDSQQAQNTFVLALDGDVDFKPEAVRLLVDQMKTNPKVASVCGRIHPIGDGKLEIGRLLKAIWSQIQNLGYFAYDK